MCVDKAVIDRVAGVDVPAEELTVELVETLGVG
jgi:hypothetical protein